MIAFVAHAAATSTMVVHLVGYLTSRGHPATFAATVTGLLGVLSVTGRIVFTAARRLAPMTTIVAAIFAVQAVAAACLPTLAGNRGGAVIAVVAFGLGFGVSSLAAPALLADRYGTMAYASIAGVLAVPVTISRAPAPLAAAALLRDRPPLAAHRGGALLRRRRHGHAPAGRTAVRQPRPLIDEHPMGRVPPCRSRRRGHGAVVPRPARAAAGGSTQDSGAGGGAVGQARGAAGSTESSAASWRRICGRAR
ncbi:hypothetical protein ACGF7U_27060 [Micromonospora sp. NPDC047670]|uniref:hypothetical protein n=1 Tax=Micromonospora sp. NPDC047670 TaxID=3364252 RepID=UPI0037180258